MAQEMMKQQGGVLGAQPAAAATGGGAAAAVTGLPALLSPAEAANALGVSEQDVMSIIESGELSAKKIGSAYRIKKETLDAFLAD